MEAPVIAWDDDLRGRRGGKTRGREEGRRGAIRKREHAGGCSVRVSGAEMGSLGRALRAPAARSPADSQPGRKSKGWKTGGGDHA